MLWNTTYCQRTHIVEYLGFAEGLPSLNINGVAQDSQGLIWFAAFGTGLIRYDGSRFKIFNHSIESKPRLTNNHLRDIIVDKKGYLWIANNAGIDIVDPKSLKLIKFIPLAGNDEADEGQVHSMCLTPEGDLWLAAYNKGVYRFLNCDPNRLEFVQDIAEAIYINQSPTGHIYCFSSLSELYVLENNHFIPSNFIVLPQQKKWSAIKPIENEDGKLTGFRWIAPDKTTKPYRLNLTTNLFEPGLPVDGITVLTSIAIRQQIQKTASPLDESLIGTSFRNFKDKQGIIWAAPAYGGVFKLKATEIDFTTCPDLKGVSLRGVIEAPNGSIYIATYNGVFQYFPKENRARRLNKKWTDLFFNFGQIKGNTITALSESTGIGNYSLKSPGHFTKAPTDEFTKDFSFLASLQLDDGWLMAGNQQIFRLRPSDLKIEQFSILPASVSVRSMCFKPFRDGKIWVGTTEGVFILSKDGRCEAPAIREDHRLGSQSRINDIAETDDGKIWFATHNYGLLCYDPKTLQIQSFDQSSGFFSNETYKIATSQGGKTIWVSTFSGLQCIELPAFRIHYFNETDGISGNEFNTGSFLQARSGAFYFGGVRGLTRFDPNQFRSNMAPMPKPYITELFIENIYSNIIDTLQQPGQDTLLHLSSGQNTLEFYFGSDNFFRSKANTYYVQLENVDADWVPLGSRTSLKFYRLTAGRYTLRVKLNTQGDNSNSQISTLSFEIAEVFYKKWSFIGTVGLLILGMIYGLIRLRKRRSRDEKKLRKTIADELHNTLGGEISGISNMIHTVGRLNETGQPFQSELHQLLALAVNAHSTMSDVIWVLNRTENIQAGIVNRMEDYLDKWLRRANIKVVFEHNLVGYENDIPIDIHHVLILVFKELLGNILKHTFSEQVFIRLSRNPDRSLELIVRNDFNQRRTDVPYSGQGLLIVQEHIGRIGGVLNISSKENSYEVHIRLKKPFSR